MRFIKAKETFYFPFILKKPVAKQPEETVEQALKRLHPDSDFVNVLKEYYHCVFTFEAGKTYVLASDLVSQLPQNKYEFVTVDKFPKPYTGLEDLNNKKLIVFNLFALGDSLIVLAALQKLKETFPSCKIYLEYKPTYTILYDIPFIDGYLGTPIELTAIRDFDYYIEFYEYVNTYAFNNLPTAIHWSILLGQYLSNPTIPEIKIPEQYLQKWQQILANLSLNKPICLLHGLASSIHRTVPFKLLLDVAKLLKTEYDFVIVYPKHRKEEFKALKIDLLKIGNIYDLSDYSEDIFDLASAVYYSDLIITADTVTVHLAASLKKECYVIAGPTEHNYPPYVYSIKNTNFIGKVCHNSCRQHVLAEPCIEAKAQNSIFSPCILSLNANLIVNKIRNIRQNRNKKAVKCPLCNSEAQITEITENFVIYYCFNCNTKFKEPSSSPNINQYLAVIQNLKNKKLDELFLISPKDLLVYVNTLPYFETTQKILFVDIFPGHLTVIARNKQYKVYSSVPVIHLVENIEYTVSEDEQYDLIIIDLPFFLHNDLQNGIRKIKQYYRKNLSKNGIMLLLAPNPKRFNTFTHKHSDLIYNLFGTHLNFELSKESISKLLPGAKIFTTGYTLTGDLLLTTSMPYQLLQFFAQNQQNLQFSQIINEYVSQNLIDYLNYSEHHLINLHIVAKYRKLDYIWHLRSPIMLQALLERTKKIQIVNTQIEQQKLLP